MEAIKQVFPKNTAWQSGARTRQLPLEAFFHSHDNYNLALGGSSAVTSLPPRGVLSLTRQLYYGTRGLAHGSYPRGLLSLMRQLQCSLRGLERGNFPPPRGVLSLTRKLYY